MDPSPPAFASVSTFVGVISPRKQPRTSEAIEQLDVGVQRLGLVLEPDGDPTEAGGILNPAATRAPGSELLLYPRCVAKGNISRIRIVRTRATDSGFEVDRLNFALQPEMPYEFRETSGYGCEDPRVTYVPVLEAYVMAYTAVKVELARVCRWPCRRTRTSGSGWAQ